MPSDEYASVGGGGALKLKGSKVKKKKSKKEKVGLEKALSTGKDQTVGVGDEASKNSDNNDDAKAEPYKTEAEKRHEETRRKRVSDPPHLQTACLNLPTPEPSCSSSPRKLPARSSSRPTRSASRSSTPTSPS